MGKSFEGFLEVRNFSHLRRIPVPVGLYITRDFGVPDD